VLLKTPFILEDSQSGVHAISESLVIEDPHSPLADPLLNTFGVGMELKRVILQLRNRLVSFPRGNSKRHVLPDISAAIKRNLPGLDHQPRRLGLDVIARVDNLVEALGVLARAVHNAVLGEIRPGETEIDQSHALELADRLAHVDEEVGHDLEQQLQLELESRVIKRGAVQRRDVVVAKVQGAERFLDRHRLAELDMDVLLGQNVLERGEEDGTLNLHHVRLQSEAATQHRLAQVLGLVQLDGDAVVLLRHALGHLSRWRVDPFEVVSVAVLSLVEGFDDGVDSSLVFKLSLLLGQLGLGVVHRVLGLDVRHVVDMFFIQTAQGLHPVAQGVGHVGYVLSDMHDLRGGARLTYSLV
jgi:hypothetical protein